MPESDTIEATHTTLAEEMAKARDEFIASQSPQDQEIIGAAMSKLITSDFGKDALIAGDRIPQFSLPNALGNMVSIKDMIDQGPVVLNFYRGGWCPFCNLEFKALTDALPDIQKLGASLVGISPETPDTAQETKNKHNLTFEVLSDVGNKVIRDFGLVTLVYEEMRPLYLQWGLDIPAANGDESWEIPIPATYVVDNKGVIRSAYVNKDYTQRMDPADILLALREIK